MGQTTTWKIQQNFDVSSEGLSSAFPKSNVLVLSPFPASLQSVKMFLYVFRHTYKFKINKINKRCENITLLVTKEISCLADNVTIPAITVGVVLCPSSFQNLSFPQYTLASPMRNGSKLDVAGKNKAMTMLKCTTEMYIMYFRSNYPTISKCLSNIERSIV